MNSSKMCCCRKGNLFVICCLVSHPEAHNTVQILLTWFTFKGSDELILRRNF